VDGQHRDPCADDPMAAAGADSGLATAPTHDPGARDDLHQSPLRQPRRHRLRSHRGRDGGRVAGQSL